MEVHGSRALQAPQVSLETEESTQIHSFASLEATSSATQRPSLPIEQNPSAVRQTSLTVGRDSNNSSNSDIASRILQKKARIQELIQQHRPGRSVENFFAFYGQRERAMAATRSSIRQGLREAPRANLPFVPDTAPVRQTRSVAQPATSQQGNPFSYTPTSHAAAVEGSNIVDGEFGDIDSFEGQDSRQVPMSIRDVPTPGNRPVQFSRRAGKNLKEPNFYDPYFPLENFEYREGFNIYRHVHFGLRSGIPVEVDFALFHLARMSYTHGDKFRLEGFPLMMEALMEKAMEITQLCTGVMWEFERDQYEWPRKCHRPNVLNTLWGTSDILQRIRMIPITLPNDTLVDEQFSHHLRNINEATLALRNLCLTPENAEYVANYAKGLIRDFLCVMINVPDQPRFNELKNNALDIAEEVTRFMTTASYDPLCISLYRCVKSPDRKHILSAVWAIVHFSSEVADAKNGALVNVGHKYVADLVTYTLCQPDPAMLSITMDYFYQYTLEPKNVEYLVRLVNMSTMFIPRMITLLSYEAVEQVIEIEEQPEVLGPAPTGIPKVPPELSSKLLALAEPERSSHWLRCCFVEDPGCEITQIALWQAYQQRFGAPQPGSGSLAAADFIKNVSATFTNAQAQVVPATGPNGQPTTKFIIKGIRPLETVLTFDGWPYLYCKWSVGEKPGHSCDHAFAEPRDLREHVFVEHMDLEALEQPNQYNYDKAKQSPKACRWDNCTRYKTPNTEVEMVVEHVGGHLPQDRDPDAQPPFPKRRVLQQRVARIERYHDTPVNENNEPVGVAYKAALILRNLLWHLPEDITMKKRMPTVLKKEFFASRYPILADKSVENRSLRVPLSDVVMLIGEYQGLGEDH